MRRKHAALITFLFILVCLFGATGVWLRSERRQYALNRQLIAALVKGDNKQALALVEAGADPNTHYDPALAPSLLTWAVEVLYRWSPPNKSPTAFLIASGTEWNDDPKTWIQKHRPDAWQLVAAMLRHGGQINVPDQFGWTPLFCAVSADRRKTVELLLDHGADANRGTPVVWASQSEILELLLQHGANVNVKSEDGWTPLTIAVDEPAAPSLVRLLLAHGAAPNVEGADETTPLYRAVVASVMHYTSDRAAKDVIRQLLAHGADPNIPIKDGDITPLKEAQGGNRPDIAALLKHYGARK